MYQLAPKVYENELTWMEYELDKNVKLLTAVYKFKHVDKKWTDKLHVKYV